MTETALSLPIETVADQALAAYLQAQKQEQQDQEDLATRRGQQAAKVFHVLLGTELDKAFLASLQVTYLSNPNQGHPMVSATFPCAGVDWYLTQKFANYAAENWTWVVQAIEQGCKPNTTSWIKTLGEENIAPLTLQARLLFRIGVARKLLEEQAEEEARKRREAELAPERERQEAEARQAQRNALILKADQTDEHWRTELAAQKQQKREALWSWPAMTQPFSIYKMTYTTGAIPGSESGDGELVQESGWTMTDHLTVDGYMRIEPGREGEKAQEIKLDLALHRPIWKRYRIAGIADLPDTALRTEVCASIASVVERFFDDLDDKKRLMRVPSLGWGEDPYSEHVGYLPLPWIRQLAEAAAAHE